MPTVILTMPFYFFHITLFRYDDDPWVGQGFGRSRYGPWERFICWGRTSVHLTKGMPLA